MDNASQSPLHPLQFSCFCDNNRSGTVLQKKTFGNCWRNIFTYRTPLLRLAHNIKVGSFHQLNSTVAKTEDNTIL